MYQFGTIIIYALEITNASLLRQDRLDINYFDFNVREIYISSLI